MSLQQQQMCAVIILYFLVHIYISCSLILQIHDRISNTYLCPINFEMSQTQTESFGTCVNTCTASVNLCACFEDSTRITILSVISSTPSLFSLFCSYTALVSSLKFQSLSSLYFFNFFFQLQYSADLQRLCFVLSL